MVNLDIGQYQKLRCESPGFSHFNSSHQESRAHTATGDRSAGVKMVGPDSHHAGERDHVLAQDHLLPFRHMPWFSGSLAARLSSPFL